ncbi:GPN-loop GTPase 3-like [Gossypium australe]|uniref:GPN-loop GTPase 3 n=1 Tax=Gossypium australe TaxID=47621 RepID=A0A5B6UKH2_9ROSI|nr:GPN-loop GTPase 3-like [Gossypium australe]
MGYAQLVIGPAGSGKSTYCSSLYQHCETLGRSIHIVNLDPAAENFDYPVAMDIRELISLDDVMEELGLGPNGGLIYCMEYPFLLFLHLEDNLDDWLNEELDNYLDDDYLVFDCPGISFAWMRIYFIGQIELFSHVPVLRNFVEHLKRKNFNVCAVYLLDSQVCLSSASFSMPVCYSNLVGMSLLLVMAFTISNYLNLHQFITDVTKYVSGCMASLSAMVQIEVPHINILSKMDLVTNKRDVENYLDPEPHHLLSELNERMAPRFKKLNKSLIELVDEYSMVSFIPLDLRKESSIQYVLAQIDNCIQYGEDADVKIRDFDPDGDGDNE